MSKDYNELLIEGEKWWEFHDRLSLMEINNCINTMDISGNLPDCFWEEICGYHATNYSSLYSMTKRMIDANYSGCFTKMKPNKSFLKFMYEMICNSSKNAEIRNVKPIKERMCGVGENIT